MDAWVRKTDASAYLKAKFSVALCIAEIPFSQWTQLSDSLPSSSNVSWILHKHMTKRCHILSSEPKNLPIFLTVLSWNILSASTWNKWSLLSISQKLKFLHSCVLLVILQQERKVTFTLSNSLDRTSYFSLPFSGPCATSTAFWAMSSSSL